MIKIQGKFSRRELLEIGSLSSFGLSIGSPTVASAMQPRGIAGSFGKAKRCIVLFMLGGPPNTKLGIPSPMRPLKFAGNSSPFQRLLQDCTLGN